MAKILTGRVSSNKPDKTIIVLVEWHKTHPLYHKQYSVSKKFVAHDEKNEAMVGDLVVISETRPLSARKRFTLDKILEKDTFDNKEIDKIDAEITEVKKPEVETKTPETKK
jgi:small subunit ribosomal protein S17